VKLNRWIGSDFMSPRYREALCEVNYIISGLDIEDKNKIPQKFLDFIESNKEKRYDLSGIDINNLREETYAILAFLYRKFFADDNEKNELEIEYQRKLKIEKEMLNNVTHKTIDYSPKVISYDEPKVVKDIIEYKKEPWYSNIFNKIRYIMKGK